MIEVAPIIAFGFIEASGGHLSTQEGWLGIPGSSVIDDSGVDFSARSYKIEA